MATPVLMEVNERDSTLLESFVEEYTRQLNGYAAIGRDILATDHSFITAGGQSQLLLNNDRALKDLLPLDGPEPSIEVCETLYRFTRGAMAKIFLVQVVCSIGNGLKTRPDGLAEGGLGSELTRTVAVQWLDPSRGTANMRVVFDSLADDESDV